MPGAAAGIKTGTRTFDLLRLAKGIQIHFILQRRKIQHVFQSRSVGVLVALRQEGFSLLPDVAAFAIWTSEPFRMGHSSRVKTKTIHSGQ